MTLFDPVDVQAPRAGIPGEPFWSGRPSVVAAVAERDSALDAVVDHAPGWRDEAWAFLTAYAETHAEVHVDDLWDAGMPEPVERRSLGPLMMRAARSGLIERTGRSRPSVHSHLSEKPIWRSLAFRGADG